MIEIDELSERRDWLWRTAPLLRPMTYESALIIAAVAHYGQVDAADPSLPYLSHPIAVSQSPRLGGDPVLMLAGLLHDAVEDSPLVDGEPIVSLELLSRAGASRRLVRIVDAVTHRPGESREDYWERVAVLWDAVQVKDADLDHNGLLSRLERLPKARQAKLMAKQAACRAAIHRYYSASDGS